MSYLNKILGILVDTRRLDVGVPLDYIRKTITLLKPFHPQRKCFTVTKMERLTGMLVFIVNSAPWLRFKLAHVYVSVAAAIKANTTRLFATDKQFRQMLREARPVAGPTRASTFPQSETARRIHGSPTTHWINRTLREELALISRALQARSLSLRAPIGHLINRDPSAVAWSDSCLYAAGGFSTDMQFWWYLEWPPDVRKHTLVYVRNN